MIKVVVFDFDGTLVDSNTLKAQAFFTVVANLPNGEEALTLAKQKGGDRFRVFDEVSRLVEPDPTRRRSLTRQLVSSYSRLCYRAIIGAPERRGASSVLRGLRNLGYRLYINTATPVTEMPPMLRHRRWSTYFCGVFGGPEQKTRILRKILRIEGVGPKEMIMVGDSEDDRIAAADVGTWFAGVTQEKRIHLRAPFGMQDLRPLLPLLQRLTQRRRPSEKQEAGHDQRSQRSSSCARAGWLQRRSTQKP